MSYIPSLFIIQDVAVPRTTHHPQTTFNAEILDEIIHSTILLQRFTYPRIAFISRAPLNWSGPKEVIGFEQCSVSGVL